MAKRDDEHPRHDFQIGVPEVPGWGDGGWGGGVGGGYVACMIDH